MTENMLVYALIVVTFGLAIVFGVYQWSKAGKARRQHEHSVAERNEGPNTAPVATDAARPSQTTPRAKEFS
jgi:Flp pilus assembly protein TadB